MTVVIGTSGATVVASEGGGEPGDLAVLPPERRTSKAAAEGAEVLAQRIRGGSVGDADKHTPIVLGRERHGAVRPSEGAQGQSQLLQPQRGCLGVAGGNVRTGNPAEVVNAVARAGGSSERVETNYT